MHAAWISNLKLYNYGGYDQDGELTCHIGCPGSTPSPFTTHSGPNYLFYSDDFNIATRDGIWMCGSTSTVSYADGASALSAEGTIDGVTGTITLRGAIPRDGVKSDVLESAGCATADTADVCYTIR